MQNYLNERKVEKIEFVLVSELYDDFTNQSHKIQVFFTSLLNSPSYRNFTIALKMIPM
ncbi:hypothetical protein PAECIP111894_05185 [Paenibacillus pseudetheri]|uniref:Uncharacterized protein n=1 Tax=Paenibacillus pseudetheri TaxID=2897682 RepID=A0ABM9BKP6_9BACL|nr:hypothetical protein PAECIP111894_05185 [Paenibacillus pseudetheri]